MACIQDCDGHLVHGFNHIYFHQAFLKKNPQIKILVKFE